MKDWLKNNYHFVLACIWLVLLIPSLIWWKDSVMWVIVLSIYANWEASMSAWNAKKAQKDAKTNT